jgi:hypothetical protein
MVSGVILALLIDGYRRRIVSSHPKGAEVVNLCAFCVWQALRDAGSPRTNRMTRNSKSKATP